MRDDSARRVIVRVLAATTLRGFGGSGAVARAVRPGVGAGFPGRPMAGQRVLAEIIDLGVAHAVEIIVLVIVLADVIHAEVEVLAVAATAFRRLMRTGLIAALPLAAMRARFLLGALLALRGHADAVEDIWSSSFIDSTV